MGDTIVVGYDGGERAKRALDRAIEEAKAASAPLVVAVAWDMPLDPNVPVGSLGFEQSTPIPVVQPSEVPDAVKPVVDEAIARAAAAGLQATAYTGTGDPATVIIEAARDNGATRIIVGRDHHSWLGRLFGDDVEAEVKRQAGCDVEVVD